ncbi:MAG: ribonuclease HII [Chloroflexota bacterium]|nr:ribonuclease HII [Chloroflexota bacterium]
MPNNPTEKPTLAYELKLARLGATSIAGVDEAGRGSLAGPVAAAAVILPDDPLPWFEQVNDSKLLTSRTREKLYKKIIEDARVGLAMVPSTTIDQIGIVQATERAMLDAISVIALNLDGLLIDAMELPKAAIKHKLSIIRGDQLSISIASASIVAKVARDSLMRDLDGQFPGYGWVRNKGYGTDGHQKALSKLGPSPLHRHSFLSNLDWS